MPYTVNGIGTWYYGKDQRLTVHGTCSQCGRDGELTSYDTTNYFVFIFIPIIPLGRFRIIEECPVCQKHRRIKLAEWERLKDEAIDTMEEEQSHDPKAHAAAALHIALSFQDKGILESLGRDLAAQQTDDADIQSLLGAVEAYFGNDDRAIEAYQNSLRAKEDPEIAEYLGVTLIREQRPEEAEKMFQHLLEPGDPQKLGHIVLLAEAYQAQGNHDRACELLEQCEELVPELASDKQFQKLRKQAEKHRGTARPLVSKNLKGASRKPYSEGDAGGALARWIFPILALIGLAAYLFAAWNTGANREVFVVNGTRQPYTALIGGREVQLPARSYVRHKIPEGILAVSIANKPHAVEEQVTIQTGFFSRPFVRRTFIINPDHMGIVEWEKAWYAADGNAPEGEWEIYTGKTLHEFEKVNYIFENFPNQLKLEGDKPKSRTRVGLFDKSSMGEQQLAVMLSTSLEPDDMHAYAKAWAEDEPDNELAVGLWAMQAGNEEFLTWIQPRLDQVPVGITLHRMYQSLSEESRPEHDLRAEYEARLDKNPNEPALQYLLGRVTTDRARELELYRAAASSTPPLPHAANALAFDHLVMGEFQEAAPFARQAVELVPDSITFDMNYYDVMLASGNAQEAIQHSRDRRGATRDFVMVQREVDLLLSSANLNTVEAELNQMAMQLGSDSAELANAMRKSWLASLAYARGDLPAYVQQAEALDGNTTSFSTAFASRDFAKAAELLTLAEEDDGERALPWRHLALFAALYNAGDLSAAGEELQKAISMLGAGDADERLLAEAFGPEGVSDPEVLTHVAIRPGEKRVYMAALGVRFPADKEQYWTLGRKLNFERTMPYYFLHELMR
ncbi:MAG: tetratricopeptide repeat protein [Planctomycetaceae bacterium]|nr:tetratricopeptide repeat protein [Planctomycetaceae bacterium]